MKNTHWYIAQALGSITQLGLSIAISFLLWIMIASYIRKAFSLGNWVMVSGILLGAGSAGLSFVKFCRKVTAKENENEK